jgi:hypothetical protein
VSEVRAFGHDEESFADVSGADFSRSEDSDRNATTHCLQCRDECCKLSVRIPCDVLTEETISPAFIEDAQDVFGEEPLIVCAKPFARDAVGLAGIAGSDEMNAATPRSRVERGKVRPDRSRIQFARFHARDKAGGCKSFPLHVTDAAVPGFGDGHTKPESSDAGAKLDAVPGT